LTARLIFCASYPMDLLRTLARTCG